MAKQMIEVFKIPADTRVARDAEGKYFPVADDDPRATYATLYPVLIIDGVPQFPGFTENAKFTAAKHGELDPSTVTPIASFKSIAAMASAKKQGGNWHTQQVTFPMFRPLD